MKRELLEQLDWLNHRNRVLMELVDLNSEFTSDYMRGFNEGLKQTVALYAPEIQKIRNLVDGFMEEDVDLTGSDEVGAPYDYSY